MINTAELFSIEAWFVGAFGMVLTAMSAVQFLCARFPALQSLNHRFEAFIDWSHAYCRVFPYLLVAMLIAVVSPVYDVLLDSAWVLSRGDSTQQFDDILTAWRYLLTESSNINSQRDLLHTLQWMIAIGMFSLYSVVWALFADDLRSDKDDPTIKFKRASLFGGFGGLMVLVSWLINFIGQNSATFLLLK